MKSIAKFTTFEDLKSCEKGKSDFELSLKKHNDFEKFIREIRSVKTNKNSRLVRCTSERLQTAFIYILD